MRRVRPVDKPLFGRPLTDFCGQPQPFRDLICELKRFLGTPSLFIAEESPEKLALMRKAWDMGKCPLTIMRSSPHAMASALKLWISCLPEPLLGQEVCQVLLQVHSCLAGLERLRVLQQVFAHVDKAALQVLFALVELLHHHRLNAPRQHPDALAAAFAPLLLPHRPVGASDAACEAALDTVIQSYRTIFSGAVPMVMSPLHPLDAGSPPAPAAAATAQLQPQQQQQQGALGGRRAVDALFGLRPLPEDASADRGCCRHCTDGCDADGDDAMGVACDEDAVGDADGARNVPGSPGAVEAPGWGGGPDGVVPEVERLLCGSMDGVLFEENDSCFLRRCEASFVSMCSNAACSCGEGEAGGAPHHLCPDSRSSSCDMGACPLNCAEQLPGGCCLGPHGQLLQAHSPTSTLPGNLPFLLGGGCCAEKAAAAHLPAWAVKPLPVVGQGHAGAQLWGPEGHLLAH